MLEIIHAIKAIVGMLSLNRFLSKHNAATGKNALLLIPIVMYGLARGFVFGQCSFSHACMLGR